MTNQVPREKDETIAVFKYDKNDMVVNTKETAGDNWLL